MSIGLREGFVAEQERSFVTTDPDHAGGLGVRTPALKPPRAAPHSDRQR
jgi:hypothetical protein